MKLQGLLKYGIPEMIIETWHRRQGDRLLPVQARAVEEGLLEGDGDGKAGNILISAPTSAGKSFCGEMAAVTALWRRRKVVMLFPLKAIAEEKYASFRDCYTRLGLRIIIVSGDHPENDEIFERGEFDLALAIYEKFHHLLTVNLGLLRQIGLVVVDELQMLGEKGRGERLEMALVKMMVSGISPRIVALSAVLSDESEIASWLKAKVIRETVRPLDLHQGVAAAGKFRWRSFNDGREGADNFPVFDGEDITGVLLDFLKGDSSRKLVFLKSKRDTMEAAFRLAAVSSWPEAAATLAVLDWEEPSFLVRGLRQTLSRGVAFHNADLTGRQRQAIEAGYRRGEIKVIFSTPTLAMGVNLPADTVFLETVKYEAGEFGGKPCLMPITAAEFQNITGRAGRFGLDPAILTGRAIILARSDFEREVLWNGYIENSLREKVVSVLTVSAAEDIVLDLCVSGLARSIDDIRSILGRTFQSAQANGVIESMTGMLPEMVPGLAEKGLINEDFVPTPLGTTVAGSGLTIASGLHYRDILQGRIPQSPLGWLAAVLAVEEFHHTQAGLTAGEYRHRTYERLLIQDYGDCLPEISAFLKRSDDNCPPSFREAALIKAVVLLVEWAQGMPVEKLEQRFQLHLGQISDLAATAAWLTGALGKIAATLNAFSSTAAFLEEYAFQVQFGLDPIMRSLHGPFRSILNRADFAALAGEQITSLEALAGLDAAVLSRLIHPESKRQQLIRHIETVTKEENMNGSVTSLTTPTAWPRKTRPALGGCPSLLELDGRYEGERYVVKVDGLPVRLTGKSFKYLAKLIGGRLLTAEGWVYKDDIESGFNQARYLYRLKQEFNQNGYGAWPIFENNRLGYYRLDLEPGQVRINLENLHHHPDFELRQLAEQLMPRLAG